MNHQFKAKQAKDRPTFMADLAAGAALLAAFAIWTILVQHIDVRPVGQAGTSIGFATLNTWFHQLAGVHMALYEITDLLSVIPLGICLGFGGLGAAQLARRKSLLRVDPDILLLGVYYLLVICAFLLFEAFPINYRPILIDGALEASYPSSTTLLVLSVMPTLKYQVDRRTKRAWVRGIVSALVFAFSTFMVVGRLIAGVHWATDIVGGALLAAGLFMMYRSAVSAVDAKSAMRTKG